VNKSFHRNGSKALAFSLLITAMLTAPAFAAGAVFAPTTSVVYYVNASVLANGDGLSWVSAFKDLQSAIQAVEGNITCGGNICQICVAEGIYTAAVG